jgi:hypothetical protein
MDTQKYICQLLEQIAGELNVKEIILERDDVYGVYHYDTLQNKTVSFDDYLIASLLFTGNILQDMETVREITSQGLKQRQKANIPVRQPLQRFTLQV